MLRLRLAVIATALAALALAPAGAHAAVTASTITSWDAQSTDTQGHTSTITNGSYLISLDNPPNQTTLAVSGQTNGGTGDQVNIVCFFGSPPAPPSSSKTLVNNVPVHSDGTFSTPTGSAAPRLVNIAGRACRLRAIPNVDGSDSSQFAGPQIAVSEAALPSRSFGGKPYDFYVNAITFTGNAAWSSAGSPTSGCGPSVAPLGPTFDITGNFAINCMGSLQGSDRPVGGARSEVQVDGQNAYDAASAQALLGNNVDLQNFPLLTANVDEDPSNGLVASQSTEGWVVCPGLITYPPTSTTCPHFSPAGVQLRRDIATSDGGDVITMTDTWSSMDGNPHSLDLLYDDTVGAVNRATQRGYQFPGQSAFSAYSSGSLPSPGAAPGSILVRSNLGAADGAPTEAVGAITFSDAPSGFTFISNGEFTEHRVLEVPAGGTMSLTYIYSTAYTVAQVQSLALVAQDRLQPLAVAVTSPASGTTVSTPVVTVTGNATAGSGISSLVVGGQTVPVGAGGAWSANIPLNPGSNPIDVLATDGAGATAHGQLTVIYQPPAPPPVWCHVPRTTGMKLAAAKRTLRRAHCRPGRVKHVRSHTLLRGRVMSTRPRAGRRLHGGAKVELFVSKGHA